MSIYNYMERGSNEWILSLDDNHIDPGDGFWVHKLYQQKINQYSLFYTMENCNCGSSIYKMLRELKAYVRNNEEQNN